jgi:hypothetical protein
VRRCYRNGQRKEPNAGHAARRTVQQARGSQQFEYAADQYHRLRPWNIRRHYAHLRIHSRKVRDATDRKPQEDKAQAYPSTYFTKLHLLHRFNELGVISIGCDLSHHQFGTFNIEWTPWPTAELKQLRSLNDAGNILDVNRAYPGAVVQGHNLIQRDALHGLRHGGARAMPIGRATGPPGIGALIGSEAGKFGAKVLD